MQFSFFFLNIELAYKGRQILNPKHGGCIITSSERDHSCVKEYIEMPTRFHRFVTHKSVWLQRL